MQPQGNPVFCNHVKREYIFDYHVVIITKEYLITAKVKIIKQGLPVTVEGGEVKHSSVIDIECVRSGSAAIYVLVIPCISKELPRYLPLCTLID